LSDTKEIKIVKYFNNCSSVMA